MDPAAKPSSLRIALSRLLFFGVLSLLLRFIFVLAVSGGSCRSSDFCFFGSVEDLTGDDVSTEDFHAAVFNDLIVEGFLTPNSNSLSVDSLTAHKLVVLAGIGDKKSPPLVVSGDLLRLPFVNGSFDFVFAGGRSIETCKRPEDLASEIARILKPEGFLVVHTSSCRDLYSLRSLLDLFPCFTKIRSRDINDPRTPVTLQDIVCQKDDHCETPLSSNSLKSGSIPDHKLQLLQSAEPLIKEEPLKPWITLKKNIKDIKYLPSIVDISFKRRYIYIDVGSRNYGSSIGSWFKKQYPKQNHTFEIFAIEADREFHDEYRTKKGVNLLPFAAWVRNESLSFEVNHDQDSKKDERGGRGMGRIKSAGETSGSIHTIQGFDFAEWLTNTVTERDFVVMKMDVEGTEFDLIPRLFETGAIYLVDELFLECHYNRWQRCCPGERSPKYQNTYGQCLDLFSSLRKNGVLVHQWW